MLPASIHAPYDASERLSSTSCSSSRMSLMLITAACIGSHTRHCSISLSIICHQFFSHAETTQNQLAMRRRLLYIIQCHQTRQTSDKLGCWGDDPDDPDCVIAATAYTSQASEVNGAGSRQAVQQVSTCSSCVASARALLNSCCVGSATAPQQPCAFPLVLSCSTPACSQACAVNAPALSTFLAQ